MNFLFLHSDKQTEWNSSEWRCVIPAQAINTLEDHHAELADIFLFSRQFQAVDAKSVIEQSEKADVIVIQRNAFLDTAETVIEYMAQGKRFVVDIDDGYRYMRRDVPSFKYWIDGMVTVGGKPMKMRRSPHEQLQWMIKLTENLSSPSRAILEDYEGLGVNRIFVPNYPRLSDYLPHKKRRDPNNQKIYLGWGGSHTHYNSFKESGIVPALERILKRNKNITLLLAGGDYRIMKLFRTVEDQLLVHPWAKFSVWPEVLSRIDIGLVPLSGAYDRRRSWIKPLEMFIMGIPWVSSPSEAYDEIPGGTQIEKNTSKYWEEAIEYNISHYKEIKQSVIEQEHLIDSFGSIHNAQKLVNLYSGGLC